MAAFKDAQAVQRAPRMAVFGNHHAVRNAAAQRRLRRGRHLPGGFACGDQQEPAAAVGQGP